MVGTIDSKSFEQECSCGFESHLQYKEICWDDGIGRHDGLKIHWTEMFVRVQVSLPVRSVWSLQTMQRVIRDNSVENKNKFSYMVDSSIGQDARFSSQKEGFNSPIDYNFESIAQLVQSNAPLMRGSMVRVHLGSLFYNT